LYVLHTTAPHHFLASHLPSAFPKYPKLMRGRDADALI
jgi:hypothetical protein